MTSEAPDQQRSLLALGRAASEGAKAIFAWQLATRLALLVTGCTALFIPTSWPKTAYALSVTAVALQAIAWILNRRGQEKHELGERARRHAMLASAFGEPPEPIEERDLRTRFSKSDERQASLLEDPTYYASSAAPGLSRLSELLQESSFWSKHLYERAASRAYKQSSIIIGGVCLAALSTLPTTASDTSLLVAKVVVVILGFIVGINVLGRARCWEGAARQTENAHRRLLAAGGRPSNKLLLGILADYSVVTAGCSPIPTALHRSEHDLLDRLWAKRPKADQP